MPEPYAFVQGDHVPTFGELRDGGWWIQELVRQWPGGPREPWYRLPASVAHDLLPAARRRRRRRDLQTHC